MPRLQDVPITNGRTLRVATLGQGAPPVVLSGGLGSAVDVWRTLQQAIGARHLTLSFARAGVGGSTAGPLPRTTSAIVADLHAALDYLAFERPFIFVGHSSGAFDAVCYAAAYPREIAGVVLVDPTIPRLEHKLARLQGRPRGGRRPLPSDASSLAAENDSLEWESSDEIRRIRHQGLGETPLVVLTAADIADSLPDDASAQYREAVTRLWQAEHRRYARLSTRVEQRTVNSGHDIVAQAPTAVEQAVARVAELGQRARPRPGRR